MGGLGGGDSRLAAGPRGRAYSVGSRAERWAAPVAVVVVCSLIAGACAVGGGDNGRRVEVRQPLGCEVAVCIGASVETSTGALVVDEVDLVFPPGLFGIDLARSYRSDRHEAGWFGRGWVTVYDTALIVDDDGDVDIEAPAGLAPLWAPEAHEDWVVAGAPAVTTDSTGAMLRWPTGEAWSFNATGELIALESPYGQSVEIVRHESSGGVTISSSQGTTVTVAVTGGVVTSVSTSDNRSVTYGYEGDRLASVTAPAGELRYAYNSDGEMVSRDSPAGTVASVYDGGRVVEQTLPGGDRIDLLYLDDRSTRVSVAGRVSVYDHDDDGRLVSRRDDGVVVVEREYDDAFLTEDVVYGGPGDVASRLQRSYDDGRLVEETIDGISRRFRYDPRGRVIAVDTPDGDVLMEYAETGPLPVAVTSPQSGRQKITYNDAGFVTGVVDATVVHTVVTRDELGNPVGVAQGERSEWRFKYDTEGNQTEMTSPGGRTWTTVWAPGRLLVGRTDPTDRRWSTRYDGAGREISTTTPGGATTTTVYDGAGRVTRRVDPDGLATDYRYGPDGYVSDVVAPGEHSWQYSRRWNGASQTETATAPDGSRVVTTRDWAGRIIAVRHADSQGVVAESKTYRYEFGNLIEAKTSDGASTQITTTEYGAAGRITRVVESLDGETTRTRRFDYDSGRLSSAQDDDGTVIDYDYDAAGRLVAVTTDGVEQRATYAQGLATQVREGSSTRCVRYDEDARVVAVEHDDGPTVVWTLDAAGRATSRTIGEVSAAFSWTSDDQLSGFTDAAANSWAYRYDPTGRLIQVTEPTGQTTDYEYTDGLVTGIRSDGGADDQDDTFTYYPATGQLAEADVRGETTRLTYDPVGRVSTIDGEGDRETWRYDAAGRVIEATVDDDAYMLSFDERDRLTTLTGPEDEALTVTYRGDDLVEVATTERDDPIAFTRDESGRLTQVAWDREHTVDLAWSEDLSQLTVSQAGEEPLSTYRLDGDRIVAYSDSVRSIDADIAPNGTFSKLRLRNVGDPTTGLVQFDPSGRPVELSHDDQRARLTYDPDGRIVTVDRFDGDEQHRSAISYIEDTWDIDGDDDLANALFADTGHARAPLPGFMTNPTRPSDPLTTALRAAGLDDLPGIELPEPDPLSDVQDAVLAATPYVPSPLGVNDPEALAKRVAAAELQRDAPTFRLNGEQQVRLPLVNPETGDFVAFNPFVDGSAAGLALGTLDLLGDDSTSLLDRATDVISAGAGGVVDIVTTVGHFLIDNPVGSLLPDIANIVGCVAQPVFCVPLTAVTQLVTAAGVAKAAIDFVSVGLLTCMRIELAACGLAVAGTGIAAIAGYQTARLGGRLLNTALAQRQLRLATTGTQKALASGRLGVRRSELLATVRGERIVAYERPICTDSVCARIDLISKRPFGPLRLIEVKNGPAARLTVNQRAVYPTIASNGAHFPYGITPGGLPRIVERATFTTNRWAPG